MDKIFKIQMFPAKCAVDLGDGSERGEYVNQDYILNVLGRPHRAINLMYCYYPLDEGWSGRASVVHARDDIKFAWDYPYDDYFPYMGGLGGNTDGEPFNFMRDIRRHGQDVILTLTIDPNLSDEYLIKIADELSTFGRLMLRINHEATGDWFAFNKRCTYSQVGDFFVRFHNIIKERAPHIKTILCIGGMESPDSEKIEKEEEFTAAVRVADIWSIDKYLALNWGYPYEIAEKGGIRYARYDVRETYEYLKRSFERFCHINNGIAKPMVISEFNADGDVVGAYEQAEMVDKFCEILKNEKKGWLSGFTLYQFRDRGRLGLEIEDPSNSEVGIAQPVLKTYKEIIAHEYFYPVLENKDEVSLPITLRWGGFEDADGLAVPIIFEREPVFCEVTFWEDLNLILEINGRWFYKSPKAKTIDLMPAFYDKELNAKSELMLRIFAPPASGENNPDDGANWRINSYTTITEMPEIRLRFEPPCGKRRAKPMNKQEYLKEIDRVTEKGKYKADWDSMKNIFVPEWYRNAKFGIFLHWGLYSVPAFNNEWYSRNMYIKDSDEYNHHIKTHGEHKNFGFKDFIPLFKAEKFNAAEWLDLFSEAGARYIMPVAEHHDGFQMYKSELSRYNAYEMGPMRDVIGELKEAAKHRGIVFCASSHRIEHWWFMGNGKKFDSDIGERLPHYEFYAPAEEEPKDHFDVFSCKPSKEFLEDWLVRCCELVDNYRPSVLYFDWWIQIAVAKPYLKKFAAYYYNRGIEWGMPVIINYKRDAFPYGCAVLDIERGQFSSIMPEIWQSCTSAARNSWCYTDGNIYKTTSEIICDLLDIVSKNGCMLLNIGPKADGSIADEEKQILREIGAWLKSNGEAVYETRCFKTFGEGDAEIKDGYFTDDTAKKFTPRDIRFTMNGSNLYAAVLNYPENGKVEIKSLAVNSSVFSGVIKDVNLLGFDEKPEYQRMSDGLKIKTNRVKSDLPVVFKILTE